MPSFSNKQITTLSFLFLFILILVGPSAHAGARFCKVDHYHSGAGDMERSQSLAKRSANRAWSSFTAWEYGQKWGNISISMDRSYNCSHPTTGWKCTVMAKPCKITERIAKKKKKYAAKKSYRKRVRSKRSYRKRSRAKKYTRKSRRRTIRKKRRVTRKKWSMKW